MAVAGLEGWFQRNLTPPRPVMGGMRHHPVTALALVVAALAAAPGAASLATAEVLREQSDLSFEISGWKVLELDNSRGSVAVKRSPDNRVHLVALKTVRGGDRKHAEQIAARIDVTTEKSGDRFIVTVHYPPRSDIQIGFWDMLSGIEFPRTELRLEVEAPDALPLRLLSTSGDLSTEDRVGPQTFETHSGDITVRRARGALEATTTSGDFDLADVGAVRLRANSGDVVIDGARGPVSVRVGSGDIRIKGATDSLTLAASSGDIHVDDAPRGLDAQTTSGDIVAPQVAARARISTTSGDVQVGLRAPLRSAEIETSNGDVKIDVAHGLGCALDLRTTDGTLDVGVPMTLRAAERHAMSGSIAGGGAPLTVRTSSGDVTVTSEGR